MVLRHVRGSWEDVQLEDEGGRRKGYINVQRGKSKYAERRIPLTEVAIGVLIQQKALSHSEFVFTRDDGKTPLSRHTVSHQFRRLRDLLKLPWDAVLHSSRHTMLTELGMAGADIFTIMKIAGQGSVQMAQRYVHATQESLERAIDRMEEARAELGRYPSNREGVPTKVTTLHTVQRNDVV